MMDSLRHSCSEVLCFVSTHQAFARLEPQAMVRHLSPNELDLIHQWQADGLSIGKIHKKISASRSKARRPAPNLTTVRRALKGKTFKRGRVETRGRKKKLSVRNLAALNTARRSLIKKSGGKDEVHWEDIQKKARVPHVHRTTAARSMHAGGYDVRWRHPRLKPMRSEADAAERRRLANQFRKLPQSYWQNRIDLYMDNKQWELPLSAKGKDFLRMTKVRGHLRTRGEGLDPGFTKPNAKKHRINTGGCVSLCAGIIGGRVRIWHYLPSRWCGEVAADLYRTVVHPNLRKYRGVKRTYHILEDNDPTGYKSNAAKRAKVELGISPIEFPAYSPDLNPLDFSLWTEVEARMKSGRAPAHETKEQYLVRLRRTAKSIPEAVIRKMLSDIKPRAESIYENRGGVVPWD